MCAQFIIAANLKKIAAKYHAKIRDEESWKPHVFPRYKAPVILQEDGERVIRIMHFGLIPFFEKNPKPKKVFHNARAETLHEKVSFKRAYQKSRCLIPIESFFEYIWESETEKWIAKFYAKDSELMTAAGLWNAWKSPTGEQINSFTIVTTTPPKFIEETGHDRCPLWLKEDTFDSWLSPKITDFTDLKEILTHKQSYNYGIDQ